MEPPSTRDAVQARLKWAGESLGTGALVLFAGFFFGSFFFMLLVLLVSPVVLVVAALTPGTGDLPWGVIQGLWIATVVGAIGAFVNHSEGDR